MRIISGSFKGKKIFQPTNIKTRPLKDLTKESIFNIINHSNKFKINLKDSNVLDLFAGVGSFGIECISRGVKNVTFVENYEKVLPVLKKNLFNLKLINNYRLLELDIYNKIKKENFLEKFNIIFLDPPYKDKNLDNILNNIDEQDIFKKDGIIIIHRHKNQQDNIPECFNIIEEKKYGISKIMFLAYS